MFKNLRERFLQRLARSIGPYIGQSITVNDGKKEILLETAIRANRRGKDVAMVEIEDNVRRLYLAARAGRWMSANNYYQSLIKKLRAFGEINPRFNEAITTFLEVTCPPLGQAIKDRDWDKFAAGWVEFKLYTDYWHSTSGYRHVDVYWPD